MAGSYDTATSERTLAEHWNGASWALQATRERQRAPDSELLSISCRWSTTMCLAVGYADSKMLVERWTGSVWSLVTAPSSSGAINPIGVSCTSTTSCEVVGSGSSGAPAALRWNGTTWSSQSLPKASIQMTLYGVSCGSATSCVAVGQQSIDSEGDLGTLAYHWNGTAWSLLNSPASGDDGFLGVWCRGAVSTARPWGRTETTRSAAHWNGSAWSAQPTASPDTNGDSLASVQCVSSTLCTAVGERDTTNHYQQPLVERWNGVSWSVQAVAAPNPSVHTSTLTAVTCVSPSTCFAAGAVDPHVQLEQDVLVARTTGSTWSVQSVPRPSGNAPDDLSRVRCPSVTNCTAVGFSTAFGRVNSTLVDHWNGATWSLQTTPNPSGGGQLNDLACPAVTSCVAVGSSSGASASHTLVERWNGSTWSLLASPSPSGRAAELNGVSCASPTSCIAVGQQGPSDGSTWSVYALQWNGSVWSTMSIPAPSEPQSWLNAVSCASVSDCEAVGVAENAGDTTLPPLVEHWNGAHWTITPAPIPSGAVLVGFNDVTCVTANACTAVGTDYDGDNYRPLIERWNGTNWTSVATDQFAYIQGVTCRTSSDCTAVGLGASDPPVSIVHWNGATWTPETAAPQSGESTGVACPAAGSCVAVGANQPNFSDGGGADESSIQREP